MDIEKIVKRAFFSLLQEQDNQSQQNPGEEKPKEPAEEKKPEEKKPEKKKPKRKKKKAQPGSINIARGALGRGRFSAFVSEAGARSTGDADGLMKDLGVKAATGSTDVDKVRSILQIALSYHSLMRQAFAGASTAKIKMAEDENPTPGVRVATAEISTRDGMKFISHTLDGAKNAGMLSLEGAIEIGLHDGEIFIKSI